MMRYVVVAWAKSAHPSVMAYCTNLRDARLFVKRNPMAHTDLTIYKLTEMSL